MSAAGQKNRLKMKYPMKPASTPVLAPGLTGGFEFALSVDARGPSGPLLHDQLGGTWEIASRVNVPEPFSTELKRRV
jgi:hypothetical protein